MSECVDYIALAEIIMDGIFWTVLVYAICRMVGGGWVAPNVFASVRKKVLTDDR